MFKNLHMVEWSGHDKKLGVKIPTKSTESLAEETGIHIGDGSMNIYRGSPLYSLRGHHIDDKNYYDNIITSLYKKLYNIDVHIRKWPDVVGFQYTSRALVSFKHKILGLPLGQKNDITLPNFIVMNKKLVAACIRGLLDTDGNVYLEKKPSGPYPRISLYSNSKPLISQLKNILENRFCFNLSCFVVRKGTKKWKEVYAIAIRGHQNINKWMDIIGSNNPKHREKLRKVTQINKYNRKLYIKPR